MASVRRFLQERLRLTAMKECIRKLKAFLRGRMGYYANSLRGIWPK
jgi:hypothetical protein